MYDDKGRSRRCILSLSFVSIILDLNYSIIAVQCCKQNVEGNERRMAARRGVVVIQTVGRKLRLLWGLGFMSCCASLIMNK